MKIALLSYEFPPDTGYGGIGTYTWYQARALIRLGHQVRVIAGSLEPGIFHGEQDGIPVTRVLDEGPFPGAIAGMNVDGLSWAPNRLRTAAGAYRALREVLENEAFDIVEFPECGGDGILVSTMLDLRTCVRFHSPARLIMDSYDADQRDIDATTFLEQIAINQADVRTSPSRFLADEVGRVMGVEPPIHLVPNGIDLDLFDRTDDVDVVERFDLPSKDAVTILWSSRLETRKGADLLPEICLAVLSRYPHVHVVLAGADDADLIGQKLRPLLGGLGRRVHALGRLPLSEVRALVKHVDIHLLPSSWDNAPYSCIEAMASGRAIVTSDAGGLPELVEHEHNGLVATTGDAGAFATELGRLVEDRPLRERLGAEARLTVEQHYTDTAVARRTVETYQHATAGPVLPRPGAGS